jgi:quinol monooxygenase YgiN
MAVYDVAIITPKKGELEAVREAIVKEAAASHTEKGIKVWTLFEATQEGLCSLNEDGSLNYELRDISPVLFTIEKYDDEEAYQAHLKTPWCNETSAIVLPRVAAPVKIYHLTTNHTVDLGPKGDL